MDVERPTRVTQLTRTMRGATLPVRFLRRLLIVSREELELYKSLKRTFADTERTQVLLDRRFRERRERPRTPAIERRRADRRSRLVDTTVPLARWSIVRLFDFPGAPGPYERRVPA